MLSMEPTSVSLSVVTVTYNCGKLLPNLIDSLRRQTDQNFNWVVVDGASTDSTVDVISQASAWLRVTSISEPDFGIYHALNKAVGLLETEYYVVVGADDELSYDAIGQYRALAAEHNADLVAASVQVGYNLVRAGQGRQWLRGGNAHVASHAVGTLIRTDLHRRFGLYSNRFVNCADMLFVLSTLADPGTRLVTTGFVAGRFCVDGVSSVDRICSLSDFFRIQLRFDRRPLLQLLLFVLRLSRLAPSLLRLRAGKDKVSAAVA